MSRKRRLTRSRQERARIHARTRRSFAQRYTKILGQIWDDATKLTSTSIWLSASPALTDDR